MGLNRERETGREGNKTQRLLNNSIFETRHMCNYNEAA